MDWAVPVVLLLLAAALAGQGARLMVGGRWRVAEDGEAGTDRAVLSLALLGMALGLGAVGAAVASAGAAVAVQVALFLVAVLVVSAPVAGVLLMARRGRR